MSGQGEKKWRELAAVLAFLDESGFSLVSALERSWSPRGHTPTARTSLNHRQRLNLLGALLVSPTMRRVRLTVRSYKCNLRSDHAIAFLKQLLRLVRGHIVLVWGSE